MPRYSWNQSRWPDTTEPEFWPCRLYDTNGVELPSRTAAFDTDTGWVAVALFNEDGTIAYERDKGEVVYTESHHPAPLQLLPFYDPPPPLVVRGQD